MNFFNSQKEQAFGGGSFRSQRRHLKTLPQTGTSSKSEDSKRKALLPGKRISKAGNTYWESRRDRSDSKGSKI